jgi:hypothetical protein
MSERDEPDEKSRHPCRRAALRTCLGQECPGSLCQNLVEDVGEDAADIVVVDFRRGIEADFERDCDLGAVGFGGG